MIDSSKCKELMAGLKLESIRKAVSSVYEKKIVELNPHLSLYVFQGEDEDYLMIPYIYCSCPDYRIRVLAKGEKSYCYHLLALCLAINNNMLIRFELDKNNVIYMILKEIITTGKSYTLRDLRR